MSFRTSSKILTQNEVISDIKIFANSYQKEIYEKKDKVLFSFWYLRWSMYWKSILLSALHTNYPALEDLKKELRSFLLFYTGLQEKTLSQIKQTSFNLIKWVKEGKAILEIRKELNKKNPGGWHY